MSCFGTLLFKLFNTLNYNKFFSILFICLFLITPPFYIISYQISGQYIVFSLIFSSIFMLLYKNYCYDNNNFLKSRIGITLIISLILFLLYLDLLYLLGFHYWNPILYSTVYITLYTIRNKITIDNKKIYYNFLLSFLLFLTYCILRPIYILV